MGEQMGQGARLVLQELHYGSLPEPERRALIAALDAVPSVDFLDAAEAHSRAECAEDELHRLRTCVAAQECWCGDGSQCPSCYARAALAGQDADAGEPWDKAKLLAALDAVPRDRADEAYRHGREHESYDRYGEAIDCLHDMATRFQAERARAERAERERDRALSDLRGAYRILHDALTRSISDAQADADADADADAEPSRAEGDEHPFAPVFDPDTCRRCGEGRFHPSHLDPREGLDPGEHMWECGCMDDVEADGSHTPAVVCDDHQAPAAGDDGRSRAIEAADKAIVAEFLQALRRSSDEDRHLLGRAAIDAALAKGGVVTREDYDRMRECEANAWKQADAYGTEMGQANVRANEAEARVGELERVLSDDVYPMVASRVAQLDDAGEEKARDQWNALCRRIRYALAGTEETEPSDA